MGLQSYLGALIRLTIQLATNSPVGDDFCAGARESTSTKLVGKGLDQWLKGLGGLGDGCGAGPVAGPRACSKELTLLQFFQLAMNYYYY